MVNFNELISEMVKNDIAVMIFNDHGTVTYDIGTGAKSHLYIVNVDNDKIILKTRYNEPENLHLSIFLDPSEALEYLTRKVKDTMCGREYVSSNWLQLMIKFGLAKVVTETKTKITF